MDLRSRAVARRWRSTQKYGYDLTVSDRYTYGKASSPESQKEPGHYAKFLRARKTGDIVVTSHTAFTREVTLPSVKWSVSRSQKQGSTWVHWTLENHYSLSDQINPYVWYTKYTPKWKYTKDELVILALAKANSREFDLLTTLGEVPETVKMLKDIFDKLRHPLRSLQDVRDAMRKTKVIRRQIRTVKVSKKGKKYVKTRIIRERVYSYKGAWLSALDLGTEAWLLYRYGIMPLVYTMQDAVSLMAKADEKLFETAKSRFDEEIEIDEPLGSIGGQGDGLVVKLGVRGTIRRTARTVVKSRYNIPQLRSKKVSFNPVKTLWELTTLSFVADWLVHVGDAIDAFTPTCYEKRAITYSDKLDIDLEVYVQSHTLSTNTSKDSWAVLELEYNNASYKETAYSRQVVSNDPWQSLTLPVGLEMNWKRSIDAFALSWPAVRSLFDGLHEIKDLPFKRK